MKTLSIFTCLLALLTLTLASCGDDDGIACETRATVKDLTGLDGCGFIFELEDGTRLEPQLPAGCGFGSMAMASPDDALFNFEWRDGKVVMIDYELVPDGVSICMVGDIVKITCLTELSIQTD